MILTTTTTTTTRTANSIVLLWAAIACTWLATGCEAWLLAQLGLNSTYRVRHLSTHFSRVFLCLEVRNGASFPTLIEAQWPETYLPMRTLIYPHREAHANGKRSDCSLIQQARWSQVDNFSRLWVLDIGWQSDSSNGGGTGAGGTGAGGTGGAGRDCPPKLLVYDLIRNNAEVLRIDCSQHLRANDARLLTIQMGPRRHNTRIEKFIYFLLEKSATLLAYDIVEQNWHRRQLVSRKYDGVSDPLPIYPIDMAFSPDVRRNELLISDVDGKLYSSMNSLLLQSEINAIEHHAINGKALAAQTAVDNVMEFELLGSLLGPTIGMMVDYTGALFYAVPKFGAIVRCVYKANVTTEDNEIIYMTSKTIRQIFFGFEGSVWLLSDRWLNPHDHCFSGV